MQVDRPVGPAHLARQHGVVPVRRVVARSRYDRRDRTSSWHRTIDRAAGSRRHRSRRRCAGRDHPGGARQREQGADCGASQERRSCRTVSRPRLHWPIVASPSRLRMGAPPSSAAVHAKPAIDVRPCDPLASPVQQEIRNVSSGVADDDRGRPGRQHRDGYVRRFDPMTSPSSDHRLHRPPPSPTTAFTDHRLHRPPSSPTTASPTTVFTDTVFTDTVFTDTVFTDTVFTDHRLRRPRTRSAFRDRRSPIHGKLSATARAGGVIGKRSPGASCPTRGDPGLLT